MTAAPKGVVGTDRRFDHLSLGTFVAVGLPDGMLGTAWPAMRHSFGVPVGDLGLILLVNTIGSVAVSAFVGRLIHRLGVIALLAVAGCCAAVGAVGYAVAPGFWLVLCIGPLVGAAAGMMDGGLNTAVALTGRLRLLNLLHGFYGVGAALGPLVVTAAILAGSWRPAYLVLAAVDLAAAGSWIVYHRTVLPLPPSSDVAAITVSDESGSSADSTTTAEPTASWSRNRVVSVLTVGLVVFFVYTGLEVSAGEWETSYLRGHVGLSASAAGLAAFGYWGTLTAVRIGLALPRQAGPRPENHWRRPVRQHRGDSAHLVAAQRRGVGGWLRVSRRRARRHVPGAHRCHAAADRGTTGRACHRVASRSRRWRRLRHLRPYRARHQRLRLGRTRPSTRCPRCPLTRGQRCAHPAGADPNLKGPPRKRSSVGAEPGTPNSHPALRRCALRPRCSPRGRLVPSGRRQAATSTKSIVV